MTSGENKALLSMTQPVDPAQKRMYKAYWIMCMVTLLML